MKLNELLGTEFPIIQGGMANIATAEFAAACSNAGALGVIAAGGLRTGEALAPIVSSGRAAAVICRAWLKRGGRLPDFVVLEGPLAGGHLGFTPEEARAAQAGRPRPLSELLQEVLTALSPFREQAGRDIPGFVAGGVKDGGEMAAYMRQGAAGAQFATRFITTEECDASPGFKQRPWTPPRRTSPSCKAPWACPGARCVRR